MTTSTSSPLSAEQLRQFDLDGTTLLDGPFSSGTIARVGHVIERLHRAKKLGGAGDYLLEPEILEVMQHPFLEAVAKQALRCDEVEFVALAARQKDPSPSQKFALEHEHVDVGYAPEDLTSTPRRMLASILVWFSDVTPETGPMMVRPRSHHQLAQHFGKPAPGSENYLGIEHLPALDFAPYEPILAKAGQLSLLTTATVHSASSNVGEHPRRVMFTVWKPKGLEVAVNMCDLEQRNAYYRQLRDHLRPERRHLVPLGD